MSHNSAYQQRMMVRPLVTNFKIGLDNLKIIFRPDDSMKLFKRQSKKCQYVYSKSWGAPNSSLNLKNIAKHQDINFDIYNRMNG